ncbi:uncharacterized protein LOC129759060 [Uranotaenia lowii]|uniref:uncharacterized protein LOC129759060 n=1 Tax=Uranotaenia lowii TaxID=190385 RepID=UPI002478D3D7|nr:uncharacterized protein LOC129759060 [Uranotaenia lowii]
MTSLYTLATLVLVASLSAAIGADNQVESQIQVVQNIAAFKAANPDLLLEPLNVSRRPSVRGALQQIVYSAGSRQSGDRLVAINSNSRYWSSPQDVQVALTYPQSGTGSIVTYVQVVVNQSSNYGRGYIASGGIGQRRIQLIIEAYSTSSISFTANIYGK